MDLGCLNYVPGAYYAIPYLASVVACGGYRPGGQQAIRSIDQISKDLPIIIIHSYNDMQLPYDGACALYYRLRANGNNNVYLVSQSGSDHIHILENSPVKKEAVRAILKKHLNPDAYKSETDLSEFQPDYNRLKKQYDELISKETRHIYLERTLAATACLLATAKLLGYL